MRGLGDEQSLVVGRRPHSGELGVQGHEEASQLGWGAAPGWDTLADKMARQLTSALPGPARDWDLSAENVQRSADKSSVKVVVECSTRHGAHQPWELTLPSDVDDDHLNLSALVTTLRANIEEWWITREREPLVAARGRRLE